MPAARVLIDGPSELVFDYAIPDGLPSPRFRAPRNPHFSFSAGFPSGLRAFFLRFNSALRSAEIAFLTPSNPQDKAGSGLDPVTSR
jgi:hypothetical protein